MSVWQSKQRKKQTNKNKQQTNKQKQSKKQTNKNKQRKQLGGVYPLCRAMHGIKLVAVGLLLNLFAVLAQLLPVSVCLLTVRAEDPFPSSTEPLRHRQVPKRLRYQIRNNVDFASYL